MEIRTSTPKSTTPVAGWLTKMTPLPFGRVRWVSKYFVLLDSEIRFYKDEHSETPSQVMNLRQVYQVIRAPTPQHPFCFRLEPKKQQQSIKPWIVECKDEFDMESWMSAIEERILKHSPTSSSFDKKLKRLPSVVSVNTIIATSPAIYRSPVLPLRCINVELDIKEVTVEKKSLLSRRKQTLPHIITDHTLLRQQKHQQAQPLPEQSLPEQPLSLQPLPEQLLLEQYPVDINLSPDRVFYSQKRRRSSFQIPSLISSSSTLPSPTGAVIGPVEVFDSFESKRFAKASLISHYQSNDYLFSNQIQKDSYKLQPLTQSCSQSDFQKESDVSLDSPTFLMYKKRFHL
ncbi:hypothetical protein A0J61_10090 [Choanephora cucurbitarum]|uniref:PH domain-containing protein n=1 Tax=Choanephora cucurbitarum TaxID=101091 RepID=A0A1C7MYJ3_9FUNG|nr:hypothetical protein A0J61_10090 [Choanephora cucurbitarum]